MLQYHSELLRKRWATFWRLCSILNKVSGQEAMHSTKPKKEIEVRLRAGAVFFSKTTPPPWIFRGLSFLFDHLKPIAEPLLSSRAG